MRIGDEQLVDEILVFDLGRRSPPPAATLRLVGADRPLELVTAIRTLLAATCARRQRRAILEILERAYNITEALYDMELPTDLRK